LYLGFILNFLFYFILNNRLDKEKEKKRKELTIDKLKFVQMFK